MIDDIILEEIERIEKCRLDWLVEKQEKEHLRKDLSSDVFEVSFGIRVYLKNGEEKEFYFDKIYMEKLLDGACYYPNMACNSYEEIENISHCAPKRDLKYQELANILHK